MVCHAEDPVSVRPLGNCLNPLQGGQDLRLAGIGDELLQCKAVFVDQLTGKHVSQDIVHASLLDELDRRSRDRIVGGNVDRGTWDRKSGLGEDAGTFAIDHVVQKEVGTLRIVSDACGQDLLRVDERSIVVANAKGGELADGIILAGSKLVLRTARALIHIPISR